MQNSVLKSLHVFFIAIVLFSACKKDSNTTPPTVNGPWNTNFIFGNFTLNGIGVTTNQDGYSLAYQNDYVTQSTLTGLFASNNLTSTSMRLYVPTESNYVTVVTNQSIKFQTNSFETPDVYSTGSFINQQTFGGQLYSVYEFQGIYSAPPVINSSNFANVVFSCDVIYKENNNAVGTRSITAEVYKR
jgi:hypothetical protein